VDRAGSGVRVEAAQIGHAERGWMSGNVQWRGWRRGGRFASKADDDNRGDACAAGTQ
jgi:hypothetical protein